MASSQPNDSAIEERFAEQRVRLAATLDVEPAGN